MFKELNKFFFYSVLTGLLSIAFLNFFVDSNYKFFKEKAKLTEIIKNIENNKSSLIPIEINLRITKKILLDHLQFDRLDVLICGSSRAVPIGNNLIKDKKILNLSVENYNIKDIEGLCMDGFMKFHPKKIIIEVQHLLFSKDNQMIGIDQLDPNILDSSKKINIFEKFLVYKYLDLFNLNYTKKNIIYLLENYKLINNLTKNKNSFLVLNSDGSIDLNVKKNSIKEIKKNSVIQANSNYNLNLKLDNDIDKRLIALVNFFRERSEVEILILPYYPDFKKISYLLNNNYIAIENRYLNIKNLNNVNILGSYDAKVIGCEEKNFYDTFHFDLDCYKKIFK
jgi:hypothetical protein